jgi:hypothetical protein
MSITRTKIVGFAAVSIMALGACSSSSKSSPASAAPAASTAASTASTAASTAASTVSGSLDAVDQHSDGKTITIKAVNITGSSGFIAIHADLSGKPGPVVGHVAIPAGASSDVVVTLDKASPTGAYWPMLHLDAGTIGTYEFPGPDVPVKTGADIVMKKITVTVP